MKMKKHLMDEYKEYFNAPTGVKLLTRKEADFLRAVLNLQPIEHTIKDKETTHNEKSKTMDRNTKQQGE